MHNLAAWAMFEVVKITTIYNYNTNYKIFSLLAEVIMFAS